MTFRWRPGDPPPQIEEHSRAKLNVLRRYLGAYLDRLSSSPFRDEFKLDLVDGFSGGGTFTDSNGVISGTPLIMIEECGEAQERLNLNRSKPLRFDLKYYFTDKDPLHARHLQMVLKERGWADDDRIVVRNKRFEDEVDAIIAEIQRRQPRAGTRNLFTGPDGIFTNQVGASRQNTTRIAKSRGYSDVRRRRVGESS